MKALSICITLGMLVAVSLAQSEAKDESGKASSDNQDNENTNAVSMRTGNSLVQVRLGEDAILTCVVIGDSKGKPVIWRNYETYEVLTAGKVRVTRDERIQVLHDDNDGPLLGQGVIKGGDVWALVVKNVTESDDGLYMCELEVEPPILTFHKISVIFEDLTLPRNRNVKNNYSPRKPDIGLNHNYTDCCVDSNVSNRCIGYCSIKRILDGPSPDPESCQADFPSIVRCMADGRNHVPCCIQERIPEICQDVCRGEYSPVIDNIKSHYSCAGYMEKTLACIVEGIELLPSPPENVEVEPLNEKQLKVTWRPPKKNSEWVTEYLVNVTTLRSYDAHLIDPSESSLKNVTTKISPVTHKVPSSKKFLMLNDLLPFTMYEITVSAFNIHGSSLPSYGIRSVTLTPGFTRPSKKVAAPKIPNFERCCISEGIKDYACVKKLCDPAKLESDVQVTDLMICAPWAGIAFGCLTDGMDHTPCCENRGLPHQCLPLCKGNVTLDFNHFICLRYMTFYKSCLLQGYGILPGPPSRLHLTNIDTDYAVVHWSPPAVLADTVQYYNLHFKPSLSMEYYRAIEKIKSPYILENLESDTEYEIYVEAVNEHGIGEPSPIIVFGTQSQDIEEEEEINENAYNVTACCENVQLSKLCMPLCSYEAKMSDLRVLARFCDSDFSKLARCGAGGRNHETCCERRGVPATCRGSCSGAYSGLFHSCVTYIGNIVQCFEEGTGILPGPPREVHAVVSHDKLFLDWTAPSDGANATSYTVHWQKVDNNTQPNYYNTVQLDNQLNVTQTMARIEGLEVNSTYHLFVVAVNDKGTSLPSSMLLLNITDGDIENKEVSGIPSPPHSLAVSSHDATSLSLSWQLPQFSLPDAAFSYTLYYKLSSQTNQSYVTKITTTVPGHTLANLKPNTQYVAWVVAHTDAGDSLPSESLFAWTDPAYPAFVEPPTIDPVNLILEGTKLTVLCIAMGIPTPNVSLYISGRLVNQQLTRHMVTQIHNVTRYMNIVTCYADNGYGTPMQASRHITISRPPIIQASGITMAAAGDSVILECKVDSFPKPTIAFWRDPIGRKPVIEGPNYTIELLSTKGQDEYTMQLQIKKITETDEGDYFCHAENGFGKALRPVSVRLRSSNHNVTECCVQMNVLPECVEVCNFHLDIDYIMDRPECMKDFDKLMRCAADGSDHRSCCASWGVPRSCLELCRGGTVPKSCALQHARRALACFRETGARMPGPPRNLKAHTSPTSNSVLLSWEPPRKNPDTVYLYRVFWRAYGAKLPDVIDTSETSVVLTGLENNVRYECVVKASNDVGTSTLSEAIIFTTAGQETGAAAAPVSTSGTASAVGVAVACILVAAILLAAGFYYRHRKNLRLKAQGGVAFENPSYLRESNPDTAVNGTAPNSSVTGENGTANGISNSAAWRQETQNPETAGAREVEPNLYEELKLGHDGAGFKRLKP